MLSEKQLEENLKKIKIKENFIIIHSDITGIVFRNFSLDKLWKIIFKSFGKNKTYIFPTFNFENNKKTWHQKKSRSETGVLSEYFRKKIATRRTIHPIHSVAIYGKNEKLVPDHKSKSSFGKGSTWEWLCNSKDVCNIGLGLKLHGSGTFCHYSEEKSKVNYREYVNLNINVKTDDNSLLSKKFSYFSRKSQFKNLNNNWVNCENDLIKKKLIVKYKFKKNNYAVIKMNTLKVTKFILNRLNKNKYYLTNKYLSF